MLICSLVAIFNVGAATGIYHITTNPAQDCDNAVNINYHTDLALTNSYVEYTLVSDTAWVNVKTATGTYSINTAYEGLNANKSGEKRFNKWEVTLEFLDSGVDYKYRVCTSSTNVSSERSFTTGKQEYSFAWVSDIHAYNTNEYRVVNALRPINQAKALNGKDFDFVLATGDVTAWGSWYDQWTQLFDSNNSPWSKTNMFVNAIGNHDYMTNAGVEVANGGTTAFSKAEFNLPKNGSAALMNVNCYFYYGDTLFINISSMEHSTAQYNWVDEVLTKNKAQYTILFQHYDLFGATGTKRDYGYNRWRTLCDKHDVDVFLSGHSHVYIRSQKLYNDVLSTDPSKGTYYMVAPSCDGDRGEPMPGSKASWVDFSWAAGGTTMAVSLVNVTATGIRIRLVDHNGNIHDDFTIPAKRGPSDRYSSKDLSNFDKKAFEAKISYVPSGLQIGQKGYLHLPFDGVDNVRRIIIQDKAGKNLYSINPKLSSGTMYLLNHFETGMYNIEIYYKDDTVKKMGVYNSVNMGLLENLLLVKNDNKVQLKFTNKLASIASKIEVYLDGELVASGGANASFVNTNSEQFFEKFSIYVLDEFNNIILDYKVSALYGDYNLDGVLDNKDCEELANMILLNKGVVDEKQDLNGDGKLDIIDLLLLHGYINGSLTYFVMKDFTVQFYNTFGVLISTVTVRGGRRANPPTNLNDPMQGILLLKWSENTNAVFENMKVYAYIEGV